MFLFDSYNLITIINNFKLYYKNKDKIKPKDNKFFNYK